MVNKNTQERDRIVLKLSGSIFGFDTNAQIIRKYAQMLEEISQIVQPIVIAGGGKIARHYINIARALGLDEASLDIIGIEVSRLNAKLLQSALGKLCYSVIPKSLDDISIASETRKIVVSGGLHPGQSTNATAALIAEKVKAIKFLNATDVDGIYDADPNENKEAKLFEEISIKECMALLKNENSLAGTYDLMDIVALKVIERSKLSTSVIKADTDTIKSIILDGNKAGTNIIFN
jgi:uridylate kinase